ncbi:MAG: AhpC/TSA family protein [Winogradskyella sp.]|uniref:peroxiredoxin-like family protein n=1 Tax=Winogradskyella sp. TaxID=1883156 RepID=UPI000F41267D|nr:peroxiredoxin-like family protein [Winogradskyella sp.]RNC88130.1 MAG: AhpC/TSA family protein [Winogradskyella sp.]
MSLTESLKAYATQSAAKLPETAKVVMQGAIHQLTASQLTNKALRTGDVFPNFNLPNPQGTTISSESLLKNGPIVVSFYRGGWCPYCNIELKALQSILPELKAKGVQLVAISPEEPDNSLTTIEKNNLDFEVLTDKDNAFAKSINLVYQLPIDLVELYKTFGIDLEKSQGNSNRELPISGTYVINTSGKIIYHFIEEDYKLRADTNEILAALR